MSGAKSLRKSLDKRVGAEGVSRSGAKTSQIVDALHVLKSLESTWKRCRMRPEQISLAPSSSGEELY